MNEAALTRLRNGGTDRLVDLLLDDVLDRPLTELLDPAWAAKQLVVAARAVAADRKLEDWLRQRLAELRKQVPKGHLPLPAEVRRPLEEVLRKPYAPDRLLVGRLLDHDTARLMLKSTFQDLLVSFGRRLKPVMPSKPPGLNLGRLSKIGEAVSGVVGQEVERQVEEKAREFMEAGVQKLVHTIADHLCDPRHVRDYASWRIYALDVLLSTDMRDLEKELEKLDPDALVATGTAIARGFLARTELEGELHTVIKAALEQSGNRSLRELLSEVGSGELGDQSIKMLRDLLRQRAAAVVEAEKFAQWWAEVVEG
jgi:hypothetical protein